MKQQTILRSRARLLLLLLSPLFSACSTVQPWEKGILARPEMTFDAGRQHAKYDDHIYFSREASPGGAEVGGGGCGCN